MVGGRHEYEQTVLEFADIYNSQYASGRMEVDTRGFNLEWAGNAISIKMPFYQTFKVTIDVLDQEDFQEIIAMKAMVV